MLKKTIEAGVYSSKETETAWLDRIARDDHTFKEIVVNAVKRGLPLSEIQTFMGEY